MSFGAQDQQGASKRTIRQCFKGRLDSVLFDDVCPNRHAVSVSPNDGIHVLDGTVIIRVFRTDHNVVCLELGRYIKYTGCPQWKASLNTYLSVNLDDDPMDGEAMGKDLRRL